MAAFEIPRLFDRTTVAGRNVPPAVWASLSFSPILAGSVVLASEAGMLPATRAGFWFGVFFIAAGAVVACLAIPLGGLAGKLRRRKARWTTPSVEFLSSRNELFDRLRELSKESLAISFLDSSNVTSHLVEAPAFLSAGCAPRLAYRQISRVDSETTYRNLVCLIRRSREAEKGSYICVSEDPPFSASLSFCLVERRDGCCVFLIHETKDRKVAPAVLVRDEAFGKAMKREFERLWKNLSRTRSPFFSNGRLNTAEDARLMEAVSSAAA